MRFGRGCSRSDSPWYRDRRSRGRSHAPDSAGDRGNDARRGAGLPGFPPREASVCKRVVVVVKHLSERGGRLRRVPAGSSRARVSRPRRRRHSRRRPSIRRAVRLELAVHLRSRARARPQARRRLPAARVRRRRAGPDCRELRGARRRGHLGIVGDATSVDRGLAEARPLRSSASSDRGLASARPPKTEFRKLTL